MVLASPGAEGLPGSLSTSGRGPMQHAFGWDCGTQYPAVVLIIWCLLIDMVGLHGNSKVPEQSACAKGSSVPVGAADSVR